MATAREIVTRALRRIRVVGLTEQPAAEVQSHTLEAFNDLLTAYEADNLTTETVVITGNVASGSDRITNLSADSNLWNTDDLVEGMWVSGSNVNALIHEIISKDEVKIDTAATGTGTGETLTFRALPMDDSFTQALVAILAVRMCEDFGRTPGPLLMRDASRGQAQIDGHYFKVPDDAGVDTMLHRLSHRKDHI